MALVTRTAEAPVGTSNKLAIFALTSTGVFDTAVIVIERLASFDVAGHPNRGNLQLTFDIKKDDEAMNTFFASYLSSVEVTTSVQKYLDSSQTTLVSGLDGSVPLGFICYGGTLSSKKKLWYGRGILSGNTGDASYSADGFGSYPLVIQAVDGMTVTIASSKFDSTEVTMAAGPFTLGPTEFGCVSFATAVA